MKIFERVNIEKCKYLLSLKKYEFEEFFPRTEDDKINEKDFTFKNVVACELLGPGTPMPNDYKELHALFDFVFTRDFLAGCGFVIGARSVCLAIRVRANGARAAPCPP